MRKTRIEMYKDKKKEWRFRCVAKNGKIVAVGEGYKTRAGCLKGIDVLWKLMRDFNFVEI